MEEGENSSVGSILKEQRLSRGLTLREVSKRMNGSVSHINIYQIESDKTKNPSSKNLFALAEFYGLDFSKLIKGVKQ